MNIFVAGASLDTDRIRECIAAARSIGCIVPCDWTEGRDIGPDHQGDHELAYHESVRAAYGCLRAIKSADLVWYVAGSLTRGAPAEVVYAYSSGVMCIASGDDRAVRQSIYTALIPPESRFASDEAAIAHLRTMVRSREAGAA